MELHLEETQFGPVTRWCSLVGCALEMVYVKQTPRTHTFWSPQAFKNDWREASPVVIISLL